jgi:hypothetical protein
MDSFPEKEYDEVLSQLNTMRYAYQEIVQGQRPWVALGDFMNDFWGYFPQYRQELLADSIEEPDSPTDEQHRWAVFCAASVEYLSEKYCLICPSWVYEPQWSTLSFPWDFYEGASTEVRSCLRLETPDAFAQRQIFCGAEPYRNKYEEGPRLRAFLQSQSLQSQLYEE